MITVRLSDERAERLDALVRDGRYPSRAAAITEAVERLVSEENERRIDEEIVAGYRRIPPTSDEDAHAVASTHESIAEEPW
jgi:Arc/MetJ-type ribon-helix-helix transcriptional regulator